MKSRFNNIVQNLTLFSALLGFAFLMSCEDEGADTSKIELKSFGPSGVQHGEMIQFIGANLDQVTSIVFTDGVEVPSSEFQTKTSSKIEIVIPDAAEAGKVTLKTPQGDILSKSMISFEVPVIINSITAEAKPGTNITISGEFINWIETVTFTSDFMVEQDDFVSQSQTELVVTVPMGAQSGFLTFTSGGTEPMSFNSAEELIVTSPVVTSLNPGSIRHETNLTISGTDLDLITEVVFSHESVLAEDFVSQSVTEIVVTVPATSETGVLTLKQMSPVEIVTDELMIILPVGSSIDPSPAEPGVDNITIAGTDLDLIAELILPGSGSIPSGTFISQTETEIVLAVPADASQGGIAYVTTHGYSNNLGIVLVLPGSGPAPLIITVFDEGTSADFDQGGGWNGTTTDFASTENPRIGSVSVKATYTGGGGGAAQFGQWNGQAPVDISTSEVFIFSIFGGAGTGGNTLDVGLNGIVAQITITEGKWVDVEMPLSDFSGLGGTVNEIWFRDVGGWSGDVYIDHIGFGLPSGPAPLLITVFDDAISTDFQAGGGWGGTTSDFESTEIVREGSVSVKATYVGDGAGAAQFGQWNGQTPVDISSLSVFAFSIYGGIGTDGQSLNVGLNGITQGITITEGEWVDVEIPLTDFVGIAAITEIWFQEQGGWSGDVYFDYIGFR